MTFLFAENYSFDQCLVFTVPLSFTQELRFFVQKPQLGLPTHYVRLCPAWKSDNIPSSNWISRRSSSNGMATGTG